jgi:hypothetical protein
MDDCDLPPDGDRGRGGGRRGGLLLFMVLVMWMLDGVVDPEVRAWRAKLVTTVAEVYDLNASV